MAVLLIILILILAVALLLKGEGGSYGGSNATGTHEKSLSTRDRNFFL